MATFRKRGPYQWEAQIRRRGFPAQCKTFETKAEAEAWANVIESEMVRGVWVSRAEAEATTLLDALDRYEREVLPAKKGAVQERSVLKLCRTLDIAQRTLANIRGADLATLRDEWLKGYEPATVSRRLAVLSHVFNVARKEWGMESITNPVSLIRKPQLQNARTRRIAAVEAPPAKRSDKTTKEADKSELEQVIAASESPLLPAIIQIAVETAMRRSEIVELRWEYIDLKRRVAHLPNTKNGAARDVPLSSRAVQSLQALHDRASSKLVVAGKAITLQGRVFSIRSDAVTRAFERAVARARQLYLEACETSGQTPDEKYLTDLRFHDLRHEATSRLAEIFPMHELTKITGHKDPRMLMRYYHPRAEDLAKKLD